MLKKIFLSGVLMSLGMGSLTANFDPSNGQWRVIAEYLYWQPSVDTTAFVISSTDGTLVNGSRKHSNFKFDSGYRLGAAYLFDSTRELRVTYTDLNVKHNKTVASSAGGFLWPTGFDFTEAAFPFPAPYAGTASSSTKFHYQNIDAMFTQGLYEGCGFNFGVEIGLEAVQLRFQERNSYTIPALAPATGPVATLYQRAKTDAIGPKVGFTSRYELMSNLDGCCDSWTSGTLSLNVCTAGSLLAAESKVSTTASTTAPGTAVAPDAVIGLSVSDTKSWRVVPALHARVGLGYEFTAACMDASLEIGYEFTSFIRGISRVNYANQTTSLSYNNFSNFDMQGLYVSGSLTF